MIIKREKKSEKAGRTPVKTSSWNKLEEKIDLLYSELTDLRAETR